MSPPHKKNIPFATKNSKKSPAKLPKHFQKKTNNNKMRRNVIRDVKLEIMGFHLKNSKSSKTGKNVKILSIWNIVQKKSQAPRTK